VYDSFVIDGSKATCNLQCVSHCPARVTRPDTPQKLEQAADYP
jgi:hypothetical protein